MKIGDLVKYANGTQSLFGIVIGYCNIMGYFTVAWSDGFMREDLERSELELVNESG